MTKKDILIFFHIYLLALKHIVSDDVIKEFRDEIYRVLSDSTLYNEFSRGVIQLKLFANNSDIYRNFYNYLERINKILDK